MYFSSLGPTHFSESLKGKVGTIYLILSIWKVASSCQYRLMKWEIWQPYFAFMCHITVWIQIINLPYFLVPMTSDSIWAYRSFVFLSAYAYSRFGILGWVFSGFALFPITVAKYYRGQGMKISPPIHLEISINPRFAIILVWNSIAISC